MNTFRPAAVLAALLLALVASPRMPAHCDTLHGPVVQDARAALAKGDVTPALKWVTKENEPAVRAAFAQTLVVRRQSAAAAELADRYFFETLVRLHRAGEGEPYTGLRDTGPEPIVAAADAAIKSGDAAAVTRELETRVRTGLHDRLERVLAARAHAEHNVETGRTYVAAYVEFVHFVEKLHQATAGRPAHGHAH